MHLRININTENMKQNYLKRIITILVFILCPISMIAQDSIPFFHCPQIQQDIDQFNSLKRGNKKWAANILEFHPYDECNIRYSYIIEAKDTFSIEAMMNNTRSWLGVVSSSEIQSLKNIDKEKHIIEAAIAHNNIGEAHGYGTASFVSAVLNIQIAFKNNKIKFDVWTSHFYIGTASNFSRNKSEVIPVCQSYPGDNKGKHKTSLAMAFININSACLNTANSYLKYMTQNHKKDLKRYDGNW